MKGVTAQPDGRRGVREVSSDSAAETVQTKNKLAVFLEVSLWCESGAAHLLAVSTWFSHNGGPRGTSRKYFRVA